MKSAKFKNIYKKNKKRIILSIILTIILTSIISTYIGKNLTKKTIDYAIKRVEKENISIMQKAFQKESETEEKYEHLIKVIKNKYDEIIEVDFDINTCTKVLEKNIQYINSEFSNYNFNGYRLDIPIGYISKSPIFLNLGPKIPIKVELADYAFGNVNTIIREFGMNNALVEIYLEIKIKTLILLPLYNEVKETSYESLLSSKIISGKVPEFYNGVIDAKSNDVSLPLTGNL